MTVELTSLTKSFGDVLAVDDVSAVAQPGQVTALLGPNGAGKTTTLRMLLGLVAPSSGTATFGGRRYDELPDPVRQVGAVLEASGYHPGRTALDHLRILATASRLPHGRARTRPGRDRTGCRRPPAGRGVLPGDAPAAGDRRRDARRPGVLVLDEPTNGLDPPGVRWLRGYVRRLADEGRTVLLSSHALSEVELIADHVLVMAHGRLLRSSTLAALRAEAGVGSRVRTPDPDRLCAALDAAGHTHRRTDEGLAVDATPEQVGELAAQHRDRAARPGGDGGPGEGLLPTHPGAPRPGGASTVGRGGALVKALLHAELLKLRSTRATALLLLATLGLAVLTVATSVPEVRKRTLRSPSTTLASWPTSWGPVSAFPWC